jgi:hypothetical protein
MKILDKFFFGLGWFKIFLSPLFIGLFFAIIVWIYLPGILGLWVGIFLIALGFLAGIIVANRVSKNEDPNDAIAQIYETPDLDKMMERKEPDENQTSKKKE